MKEWNIQSCPWLPATPDDFRERCRAIGETDDDSTLEMYRLAQFALSNNQLNSLARTFLAQQKKTQTSQLLKPFRLGLVSNATTGLFVEALVGSCLRFGIALTVVEAHFGQVMQEALDPDSPINKEELDGVLLALDYRGINFKDVLSDVANNGGYEPSLADDIKEYIDLLIAKFSQNGSRVVIVQTIPQPTDALFGSYDARLVSSIQRQITAFNSYLATLPQESGTTVLDVAKLANRVGLDSWHDPIQWNFAKLPFSQKLVPLYGDYLARLLGAIRGKSRKCLVLDLDNTLWGGVIGDDGLEGIMLDQGNAQGEAFLAIQRTALNLRNRGIVLAVCSKNDEKNGRLPFRKHPDMILKEEHIAVFLANWHDKASNLEEIARVLNIGLDSLVFLDDNPAERAQVREALPQVAVPELPDDPAYYPRALLAGGYFESIAYTPDDKQRAEQYQANSQRTQLQSSSRNIDEFLQSLAMKAQVSSFNQLGRSRIVQLINKTNQFNLTTRRYTEAQVIAMERDDTVFTLQVRLQDRFGDNGMISVVICRTTGTVWDIDIWLMSCRVLKRRVEEFVLEQLITEAKKRGITVLRGVWIPSSRNDLVKDHYPNLNFKPLKEENGATYWQLAVKDYTPTNPPIVME
ncbi:MAG: HAD-IIIC family phosphatase [Magnetococcales bacterium]|nr:HAD-IIIC family phosphatase [Magnetococcales bacterium]